jgi:hypothetical protein
MQPMQFRNSSVTFNDILGGEMYTSGFTEGGVTPRTIPGVNPRQWDDKYSAPHFGRYGGGP